jgi:hypothetical protein
MLPVKFKCAQQQITGSNVVYLDTYGAIKNKREYITSKRCL